MTKTHCKIIYFQGNSHSDLQGVIYIAFCVFIFYHYEHVLEVSLLELLRHSVQKDGTQGWCLLTHGQVHIDISTNYELLSTSVAMNDSFAAVFNNAATQDFP